MNGIVSASSTTAFTGRECRPGTGTAAHPCRVITATPRGRTAPSMWVRGYRRDWLGSDLVAGAVAA